MNEERKTLYDEHEAELKSNGCEPEEIHDYMIEWSFGFKAAEKHINKTHESLIRQIDVLKKREERLVEALQFYAINTQDQITEVSLRIGIPPYDGWRIEDDGEKARQTLKELSEASTPEPTEIKTTSTGHKWEVTDTTAKDLATGLVWDLKDEEGYFTYDEAVDKFGDKLPTIEEFRIAEEHGCRDVLNFKDTWYWSASVVSNFSAYAWLFYAANGNVNSNFRVNGNAVQCVVR